MINSLHVEVCQKIDSTLPAKEIEELIEAELASTATVPLNKFLPPETFINDVLKTHVHSVICFCGTEIKSQAEARKLVKVIHVYQLNQEDAALETMNRDGEDISAALHWMLPCQEFFSLWENLFYDSGIKENLLSFVETAMLYSQKEVNPHIISWNKVVLLHGPPGTGKTSLCKALAQKLSIRFNKIFHRVELVEINSHSLFSKWFSESGKLVMNLFNEIKVLIQDEKALICILIDEIESLAHARKSCANGTEPSDSVRVVNALLTQLDSIKNYSNVLILTTSNLTEAIDLAFVDRADIKQYIALPNEYAIYKIFHSCIIELMRTGFIHKEEFYDIGQVKTLEIENDSDSTHSLLLKLSKRSMGLSGRTLRKIPFLAQALFLSHVKCNCSLQEFLQAMHLAVQNQKENCIQ